MKSEMKLTITICLGLWLLTCAACRRVEPSSRAAEPPDANAPLVLTQVSKTRMLRAREGDPRPFFRAEFNVTDRNGNPVEIEMPKDLKSAISIAGDKRNKLEFKPFFVFADSPSDGKKQGAGGEMMLLVDVSGSMKAKLDDTRNRLQVAQEAAQRLLRGFREGIDRIAIIPFESRDVEKRIRDGEFVDTVEKAQRQIAELNLGDGEGNTALYSATETALLILQERKSKESSQQYLLAVLTDGKNDVDNPIDDKELLGNEGLGRVKELAGNVGIPVYTIGVGTPGKDFNEDVLRQMASNGGSYFSADKPEELNKALDSLRRSLQNRLQIAFYVANRRVCEAPRSINFKVQLTPPGKNLIESGELVWTGGIAGGAPEGELNDNEKKALTELQDPPPLCDVWGVLLRRLGMLGLLSAGLAALWFFAPRFFWPRPTLPQMPGREGQRPQPSRKPPRSSKSSPERDAPPAPSQSASKPRRQFEETRIYDDHNRGNNPKS